MSNGCGCEKGLLRFVKPPMAKYFYTACCIHDDDYDRGGNAQDRKKADQGLFLNMLHLIRQRESSPWKVFLFVFVALLYYVSVRLFGRFYYEYRAYNNNKDNINEESTQMD